MTRSAMLEVLREDYVRTARAKGLPYWEVVLVHALRNALIPVITVIGLQVGLLLSGAILTETIFSWPGVGNWLIHGVQSRDYPVVQGGILLIATIVIIGQPDRRPALRRGQPAHPPWLTRPALTTAGSSRRAAPGPLREFWLAYSQNRGALIGPGADRAAGRAGAGRRRRSRRTRRTSSTATRRWCRRCGTRPAAVVHPRHRPRRPRHAVAADPRHAAVAADRRDLGGDLARARRRCSACSRATCAG